MAYPFVQWMTWGEFRRLAGARGCTESKGKVSINGAEVAYHNISRLHGLFSHGGSNQNIRQFKSVGNTFPVTFAPHFTTPTIAPTGNTASGVTTAP